MTLSLIRSASAQTPDATTAPILQVRVPAIYPTEALRTGREGSTGLELHLDAAGAVIEANVLRSAGADFDEAALVAVRQFKFEPARRGTRAVPAIVTFTYAFQLPIAKASADTGLASTAAVQEPAQSISTPARLEANPENLQSTLVLALRPIGAASSFSVRDRDFQLRPIGSVQDILRVTPGLVLVQHSGGGKANQYFLRGFDADHGTDLALSIDGVPINMVSHAHGQGYSDSNFIIPEVIERVEISKGPYFVQQGDFATAGAINMISRDSFESSSVGFGLSGSPGYGVPNFRALVIASPKFDSGLKATFAAEASRQNGPFENPNRWDNYKLFNKLTYPVSSTSSLSLIHMSYGASWNGSGQIPARAVERGNLTRFGSIDPDEGGASSRHQMAIRYKLRPNEHSELSALAYLGSYRFNMFSNFTLFTRDPAKGDEIEQRDRRSFLGGRLHYHTAQELHGIRFDTSIGGEVRNDDIRGELWNTAQRQAREQVRGHQMYQTNIGVYASEEITPFSWLRVNTGLRADSLSYAVETSFTPKGLDDSAKSGTGGAYQLSPKASIIVSPLQRKNAKIDTFLNFGHGFHSNDVRGAFATPAITPLTRAVGTEVGSRGRFFERWDIAAAFFQLDLENETVWVGDEGTTEVGAATRRQGIELETRFEFTPWLAADLDVTITKSRFNADGPNSNGLALAPKQTYSGGISARHELGPGLARAALRFYGVTDRPGNSEGDLIAKGFTMLDLHAGYRIKHVDVALDIENLLNQNSRAAQFSTVSRLATEPALGAPAPSGFNCGASGKLAGGANQPNFQGCEDMHFTPQYPLTLRATVTLYFQ